MSTLHSNIINTKNTLLQTMNNWLDPTIMKQIHSSEENGSFFIASDEAPDVKKYKAVLNILNCLGKLTNKPSALQMATLSIEIVKNIQQFDLHNLTEFKSYFSELFEQNPGLSDILNKAVTLARDYLQSNDKVAQNNNLNTSYVTQIIDGLKQVEETGVSFNSLNNWTAANIATKINAHFASVTNQQTASAADLQEKFKLDQDGNYIIDKTDSKLIKDFKNSINIVAKIQNLYTSTNRVNKFNRIIITGKLLPELVKALRVYYKSDLTQEKGEYAAALTQMLKEGLDSIGPILQDLNNKLEIFEVEHKLKPGVLLDQFQVVLTEYETALKTLGMKDTEKQYDFNTSRKEQLQKYEKDLDKEIATISKQKETLSVIYDYVNDMNLDKIENVDINKILFVKSHLAELNLPIELSKNYDIELQTSINNRLQQVLDIFDACKDGGLQVLPFRHLRFLRENIVLTNISAVDIEIYKLKIDGIVNARKDILKKTYNDAFSNDQFNFKNLSNEQLQILKDNVELLDISEYRREQCKSGIEKTLKDRENSKKSWNSYFYTKLVDASAASLNIAKSVTDTILHLSGTNTVNKVFKHLQQQSMDQASMISCLMERKSMLTQHLEKIKTLPEAPLMTTDNNTPQVYAAKNDADLAIDVDIKNVLERDVDTSSPISQQQTVDNAITADQIVNTDTASATEQNETEQKIGQDKKLVSDTPTLQVVGDITNKNDGAVAATVMQITRQQLAKMRDLVWSNLENWLDPVIMSELKKARKDEFLTITRDDSRVVKNYKAIINIISYLTAISSDPSIDNLLGLAKNISTLKIDDFSGVSAQFGLDVSIKEQLQLIINRSPELNAIYYESVKNIQAQIATGQAYAAMLNIGNSDVTGKQTTKPTEKEKSTGNMFAGLQSGLNYLKSLADARSTANDSTIAANDDDFVDEATNTNDSSSAKPNVVKEIEARDSFIEENETNDNLEQANTAETSPKKSKSAWVASMLHSANTTNAKLIDAIEKTMAVAQQPVLFKKSKDGLYKYTNADTEVQKDTKVVLNSLASLQKLLQRTEKLVLNPYSINGLNIVTKVIQETVVISNQIRKFSLHETTKASASKLLDLMHDELSSVNANIKTLVCTMDAVELNYGLKQGSLLSIVEPALKAYQIACRELNVTIPAAEAYPYKNARITLLQQHNELLENELAIAKQRQKYLTTFNEILTNLGSARLESIECDDLILLRDNLPNLHLDKETEKSFKYDLNSVLSDRLNTVAELLDINNKLGINFLSADQLRILRDNVSLLPISDEQKANFKRNIANEIFHRIDHGDHVQKVSPADEVSYWLGFHKMVTGAFNAGVKAVKVVTELTANQMGLSSQSAVLAHVKSEMNALQEKIQSISIEQSMVAKNVASIGEFEDVNNQETAIQQSNAALQAEPAASLSMGATANNSIETTELKVKTMLAASTAQDEAKSLEQDKMKNADAIIAELTLHCNHYLTKLNERRNHLHEQLNASRGELKKPRDRKSKIINLLRVKNYKRKNDKLTDQINILTRMVNILQDTDITNPIEKINKFNRLYRLPYTTKKLRTNKILGLAKTSGYYLAKIVTLGKASLFRPVQQQFGKQIKKNMRDAEQMKILTTPKLKS